MNVIHYMFYFGMMLCCFPVYGQEFNFRRVNSGIKYNIEALKKDKTGHVYFLSNKAYQLQGETWTDLGIQAEIKINTFNPLSEDNIWFSGDNYKYTSDLYHYKEGELQVVKSPFANQITCVEFFSEQEAIFGGYQEIAAFSDGEFQVFPHTPSASDAQILKIAGDGVGNAWLLYKYGNLYHFNKGVFTEVPCPGPVRDFSVKNGQLEILLTEDGLYQSKQGVIRMLIEDPVFKDMHKFLQTDQDLILIIGENGKLAEFYQDQLFSYCLPDKITLTDILDVGNEIWISGEDGVLYYDGKRTFPAYNRTYQGFTAHKLSVFHVPFQNEFGVAMDDIDRDGKYDIYTVRISEQNRLLINKLYPSDVVNDFTFSNETLDRKATGDLAFSDRMDRYSYQLGLAVADIDNDNDQDIYLCNLNHKNRLMLNNGKGFFRNVSHQENRATDDYDRSNSALFADVDLDGDLDLFVTSENSTNRLFLGDGTGFFTDITEKSGISSTRGGMSAAFADVDHDGLPDLVVSFWYGQNKLYLNTTKNGNVIFKDVTQSTDLALAPAVKSNAVVFADVDNDGNMDLYIANRNDKNRLYINNGTGRFLEKTSLFFDEENEIQMSNGAVFADFNLDGYQDLYVSNVGNSKMYINVRGQRFKETTALYGAELYGYGTGSAVGDIDDDGDPDLYVANYLGGDSKLFINQAEGHSFIKFTFKGVVSNKDGIGTKVWVTDEKTGLLVGYRELMQGMGYGSSSAKEMIFGVPDGMEYQALVKFPLRPDTIQLTKLKPGDTRLVAELEGFNASCIIARNFLVRNLKNRELHPEYIKVALILILMILSYRRFSQKSVLAAGAWLVIGMSAFGLFLWLNHFFIYQRPSYKFFIAPFILTGLLVIQSLFITRFLLIKRSRLEKQRLREHLARDLHDDLASTLGSILIYSKTISTINNDPPKQKKISDKIGDLSQKAIQSTSDIIWMTSPRNDSFQDLISKCSSYLSEVMEDNNMQLEQNIDLPHSRITMVETLRNNIFLILKESVHNIVKHSQATNVSFSVFLDGMNARLILEDDGKGFEQQCAINRTEKSTSGYGLLNMIKRAEESGIDLKIHSVPGEGTTIRLNFKL